MGKEDLAGGRARTVLPQAVLEAQRWEAGRGAERRGRRFTKGEIQGLNKS